MSGISTSLWPLTLKFDSAFSERGMEGGYITTTLPVGGVKLNQFIAHKYVDISMDQITFSIQNLPVLYE